MQIRDIPIQLMDPATQQPLLNYSAQVPKQNFSQALPIEEMRRVAEMPLVNAKEAANVSMLNSMPILRQAFSAGNERSYKMAMPIIEKLAGSQVAASEQQANIANEQTKRQQMISMMDMLGKAENAKNFGIIEGAMEALTKGKVDPVYAGLSFVNPTSELQMANSAATHQLSANMQQRQMDQMAAYRSAVLANKGGAGQSVDPRLMDWAQSEHEKALSGIMMHETMGNQDKIASLQAYMRQKLPVYASSNPLVKQNAINDMIYALNYIEPGYGDKWASELQKPQQK